MRTRLRVRLNVAVFAAMVVVASAPFANACGDKLLVLGRGVKLGRISSSYRPSIIAYVPESLPPHAAVNDAQFQAELRRAGVQLRLVQHSDALAEALQSGRYDVILVDLDDAAKVNQQVVNASVTTVVMPVVYKGADMKSAALTSYRCIRKAGNKNGDCFSTIEKAIESKLKRDQQQGRASN